MGEVVGAATCDFADDFDAGFVAFAEPDFSPDGIAFREEALRERFVDDGYL